MTEQVGRLYDFVWRGLLSEESLDRAGRRNRRQNTLSDEAVARTLSIDLLDNDLVAQSQEMATVYTAIAAFENSVRKLIKTVLLEQKGENWWEQCVSEKIRLRADQKQKEEEKIRWHSQRGADPIYYILMSDLVSIIRQNWLYFEPHIPSIEWAASILDVVERSRNVIMHSGILERADAERIGIFIRDWVKQVGA